MPLAGDRDAGGIILAGERFDDSFKLGAERCGLVRIDGREREERNTQAVLTKFISVHHGGEILLVEDRERGAVASFVIVEDADDAGISGIELPRRIENGDQKVGVARGANGALDADALDYVARLADAGGVAEHERIGAELYGVFDNIAGGARDRRDDGAVGAEYQVEDAGFAGVGFADDGGADALAREAAAREAVVQHQDARDQALDFRGDGAPRR